MKARVIGPQECDQRRFGSGPTPKPRNPVLPAALVGLAIGWGIGLLSGLGWVS